MDREQDVLHQILDVVMRQERKPALERPAENRCDLTEERPVGVAVAVLRRPHEQAQAVAVVVT